MKIKLWLLQSLKFSELSVMSAQIHLGIKLPKLGFPHTLFGGSQSVHQWGTHLCCMTCYHVEVSEKPRAAPQAARLPITPGTSPCCAKCGLDGYILLAGEAQHKQVLSRGNLETGTPAIGISKQIVGTPLLGVFVYIYIQTQEISVSVFHHHNPVCSSNFISVVSIIYLLSWST